MKRKASTKRKVGVGRHPSNPGHINRAGLRKIILGFRPAEAVFCPSTDSNCIRTERSYRKNRTFGNRLVVISACHDHNYFSGTVLGN
jgi:hypothetical protein